jgi:ABC-2 type transport system permease protein
MNMRRVSAIVRKDLQEVTSNRTVVLPMAIVPLVMCVVLPSAILLVGLNLGGEALGNMAGLAGLADRYPVPPGYTSMIDRLLFVFLNYSFLGFFLIIPLLVSSIIAANSVVGEKERGTLETLLYTPVSNRELVLAKLMSSFVPALVVTVAAFAAYFLIANGIWWAYRGGLVVRSVVWLPALLLLSPAVSLLGLSATLLVSLKAKTYTEAQQASALIVVPLVAMVYAQLGGAIVISPLLIAGMGVIALAASWLIFGKIGPRFSREQILMTL